MTSIRDIVEQRNQEVEEQIVNDLRKLSRYERRKAFRQAGVRTEGSRNGSNKGRRAK